MMTLKNSIITAFNGLRTHKSRSSLTILGIVIGITAIIVVMSIGEGAQNLILGQIQGLGSQTIIIEPGKTPSGPSDFTEILTDSLKEKDVIALGKPSNVQGVKAISPNVGHPATLSFENQTTRTTVLGVAPVIADMLDLYPSLGEFFTDEDVKQSASVVILGSEMKTDLFGESDAINQNIKIKGKTFRVIGVIAPKGQVSLFNIDKIAAIPYSTAQKYLTGTNYFNSIIVQAENDRIVPQVVNDIKLTLRESHNIDDPSKDDFHVMTQADIAERASTVTGILTALLVSVAAISLIVGGIGIMNIMIVSVTERTREIGLRKALGATRKDILTQFLLESIILTGFGGIIGIILGAAFSFAVALVLAKFVSADWTFSFPISAAIIGITVSTAIGLIFGLYPARQASLKSPIEALRYE